MRLRRLFARYYFLCALALIVATSSILGYALWTNGISWGDDFALYIMQARSIVEGQVNVFLARNTYMLTHSTTIVGPIATTWGYPVLLAPLYWLRGLDLLAFKLLNLVGYALFLITLFLLFHRRLGVTGTLLIVAVFAFNPHLLRAQDEVLSDIPFLFFSTLTILLIDLWVMREPSFLYASWRSALLGVVAFAAFWIRINGILLLLTLLMCQLDQALWRKPAAGLGRLRLVSALALPYAVFGLLLVLTGLILPQGGLGYENELRLLNFTKLWNNLLHYLQLLSRFFPETTAPQIIYGFTLPFLLLGVATRRRQDYHLAIYSILTMSLYLVWTAQQGLRFFFPILPFYIYFTFQGMVYAARLNQQLPQLGKRLNYAFWFFLILFSLYASLFSAIQNLNAGRRQAGPYEHASRRMFDFIIKRTPPNSVIIFFKPRAMRLMTDRDAIQIDRCGELGRGDYVVIYKKSAGGLQVAPQEVEHCNPNLEPQRVFENTKFTVYRLHKRSQ